MAGPASGLETVGRIVLVVAAVLVVLGIGFILMGRLGWHWRPLPGDIVIRRPGMVFYFPIVTMLVISLVISLIMHLISYLRR